MRRKLRAAHVPLMMVKLLKRTSDYPDLTPHQTYAVIGIEADDFRILNDRGKPYLYPRDLFAVVDAREPEDWVTEVGDDGERYAYPPPLNTTGFFEDYFDGQREVVAVFWQVVNQRLAAARLPLKRAGYEWKPPAGAEP